LNYTRNWYNKVLTFLSFLSICKNMNKAKDQFSGTGQTNNQKQIIQGILTSRIETKQGKTTE